MEHALFVEAIDIHCDRLKASALRTGPSAPVPTCPKWTVQDLVAHVAMVLSWAVTKIADPARDPRPGPADWEDLLGWWDGQRMALREMLSRPADTPAWFPFLADATLTSWARRMAHETAIHRLDAEAALGHRATTFSPAFATDGVDEFLGTIAPARLKWTTEPATIQVRTIDTGHDWTLRCSCEGIQAHDGVGQVTLTGSADDVYRALWGRPNGAEVLGDHTLLKPLTAP